MNAKILGTGSYLPERVLTNQDLEQQVETSDEWIRERTGMRERHIAAADETASSMGVKAAKAAINAAGLYADDIDMVICSTAMPDTVYPNTACYIQHALGLRTVPAFDVSVACTGSVYALSIADQFIKTGQARNILVVASEIMSRVVDWQDRGTCVLFGDGAGAVVLGATDEPGIIATHLHADGSQNEMLYLKSGFGASEQRRDDYYVFMQGNEVFKVAVKALGDVVLETLEANKLEKTDIDWLIPHQANLRIIKATAKKLQMPLEKVILTLEEHGNTSSASVLLALDHGIRNGQVKRGELLLLEAFGAGIVWGSALIHY